MTFENGHSEPKWAYSTGGAILGSPAVGSDGVVRVHSTDGFLHLINANSGDRVAVTDVGPPLGSATPMLDEHNRTWVARADGGLIVVEANGDFPGRPYYRTRRRFDCIGVIFRDMLYIGCEDHYVHAVPTQEKRGTNRWSATSTSGRTGCAINCPLAMTPTQELLVVSQDDRLHAFKLDGSPSWTVSLPGQSIGSPVIDQDGTILVGICQMPRNLPPRGMLMAIDGVTHRTRWQFQSHGETMVAPIESTPVLGDDGRIYFGDNNGCIYALHSHGELDWYVHLDAPVRSAGNLIDPELVAFGLDDGSLVAIKCSSTRLASQGWPKLLGLDSVI